MVNIAKKMLWGFMGILAIGLIILGLSTELRWTFADVLGFDYENRPYSDGTMESKNDYGTILSTSHSSSTSGHHEYYIKLTNNLPNSANFDLIINSKDSNKILDYKLYEQSIVSVEYKDWFSVYDVLNLTSNGTKLEEQTTYKDEIKWNKVKTFSNLREDSISFLEDEYKIYKLVLKTEPMSEGKFDILISDLVLLDPTWSYGGVRNQGLFSNATATTDTGIIFNFNVSENSTDDFVNNCSLMLGYGSPDVLERNVTIEGNGVQWNHYQTEIAMGSFGCSSPRGVADDPDDDTLWVLCGGNDWMLHVNETSGTNITDGFPLSQGGSGGHWGLTFDNNSYLTTTNFNNVGNAYRYDKTGTTKSTIDYSGSMNNDPSAISFNGTDFFLCDYNSDMVASFDQQGGNNTDIAIYVGGEVGRCEGMDMNASVLYVADADGQLDGYDLNGSNLPNFNYNSGGFVTGMTIKPNQNNNVTEMWYVSDSQVDIYHFKSQVTEIGNHTIGLQFNSSFQDIYWTVDCWSGNETLNSTSPFWVYTLGLAPTFAPQITNQFPADNSIYATNVINFTYNVSSLDSDTIDNCTLFINDLSNTTDTTITETVNQTFNITLEDAEHLWKVNCYDNSSASANSTEWNVTTDITAPVINLSTNLVNITNTTLPSTSIWHYNVSDNLIGLESCWYSSNENTTNTTVTCNQNITTTWNREGVKVLNYCANDTLGNENCSSSFITFYYYNWTQSNNKLTVGEGDTATFRLTLNMTDLQTLYPTTYAYLVYNNTLYSPATTQSANNFNFSRTLTIPSGTGSTSGTAISWNWTFTIQNATFYVDNTSTSNQTQIVYSVSVDDCSSNHIEILNYSLQDEENRTTINGTIESNVILSSYVDNTVTWNYSTSKNDTTFLTICISNNTLNSTNYLMDVTTRYESANHEVEYHYVDNYNLTNTTSSQNFTLHDLLTSDSTSFLINYKSRYYLGVSDVTIDIHRFYVGDGLYRSVEMGKTNDAGQTRAHLVTEDVKYRFYARANGTLLYASPEYLALCLTAPCEINLYESADTSSTYEEAGNINYDFDTDESTRIVLFNFVTEDGTPSTVYMNVTRTDNYLNLTACEESQTSSSGTLTCTVPQAYDNTTYLVEVWEEGEFITQILFNLNPSADEFFPNGFGIFLSFIIIITLVFMSITSGIAMVSFTIIGLICVSILNLLDVGVMIGYGSAVIWLLVAGLIIIIKISKKRYH